MGGNMKDVSVVHSRKVVPALPLSRGRKSNSQENQLGQMDTAEFLWMSGGAVVVGTGIYLLSFLLV